MVHTTATGVASWAPPQVVLPFSHTRDLSRGAGITCHEQCHWAPAAPPPSTWYPSEHPRQDPSWLKKTVPKHLRLVPTQVKLVSHSDISSLQNSCKHPWDRPHQSMKRGGILHSADCMNAVLTHQLDPFPSSKPTKYPYHHK